MTKLFSCESNHQPKLARSWLSFNAPFYGAGRELAGLRVRRTTPNPPLPLLGGGVEFEHFRLLPKMREASGCHPTGLNTICFFLGSILLSFNNQPRDE